MKFDSRSFLFLSPLVAARMADSFERTWITSAEFLSDGQGRIDPARQSPVDGGYTSVDPLGLIWSMELERPTPADWEAPPPRDFNHIRFELLRDSMPIAEAESVQWIIPPDLQRSSIPGLVAELFTKPGTSGARGVLVMGGSGGGMSWARRTAAALASDGYAAMALAYFGAEGLPPDLIEIPVEYVESALDSLASRPEARPEGLAIVGYSKGAELGLLVASRRPDLTSVVGIAPGSAVFQGFRVPDYPVVSSWSADGRGLPFVPHAYDAYFFETFDGMYLWYRTLGQHELVAQATIPVERIQGDILLVSGVEDRIWPSTFMGEQIVARLGVNDFAYRVQHLAFAEAGHGIAGPPGEPLTSVAERLGGTAAGNARAKARGWAAILDLLGGGAGE